MSSDSQNIDPELASASMCIVRNTHCLPRRYRTLKFGRLMMIFVLFGHVEFKVIMGHLGRYGQQVIGYIWTSDEKSGFALGI